MRWAVWAAVAVDVAAPAGAVAQGCRFDVEGIRTIAVEEQWCSSAFAADFDGDGLADVAAHVGCDALGASCAFRTYRGSPGGWLRETSTYSTGGYGWVSGGQFDGDGIPDLVAWEGGGTGNLLRVFLGDGTGGFQALAPFGTPSVAALSLQGIDLGGGPTDDLAILDGSCVWVHIGNGDGTFGPGVQTNLGFQATRAVAADFDADSLLDLAVVGSATAVWVLIGNGDGTFQPAVAHPFPWAPAYVDVDSGDLDGNGTADLVAGRSSMLGNGDGTFQAPVDLPAGTQAGKLGDMDGDGILDLVYRDDSPEAVCVAGGVGDGTFSGLDCARLSGDMGPDESITDVDGDGSPDVLLFGRGALGLAHGRGDGTLSAPARQALAYGASDMALADLDHDGLLDLVGGQSGSFWVARGRSDGTFEPAWPAPPLTLDSDFVATDVDGDGHRDVVTELGAVLLGVGDGTLLLGPDLGLAGAGLAEADLDGDGRIDLLAPGSSGMAVWLGLTYGTPTAPTRVVLPFFCWAVTAADFDGDGDADAAAGGTGGIVILEGDGAGALLPVGTLAQATPVRRLAAADMDEDGKPDLVVTWGYPSGAAQVQLFRGGGNLTFQPGVAVALNHAKRIGVEDFDGDGHLDVMTSGDIVQPFRSLNISVWHLVAGDGAGGLSLVGGIETIDALHGPDPLCFGDVVRDGAPDAVAYERAIWNTAVFANAAIGLAPPDLADATVGAGYTQIISGKGGTPPYTLALISGSLPPGLSLAAGGLISGTPLVPGLFALGVQVTDAGGCARSKDYLLRVAASGCPSLSVAPATLPEAFLGAPYLATLSASGGSTPYGFRLASGAFPPGLALSTGGTLAGTPSGTGTFEATVEVVDAAGCVGMRRYLVRSATCLSIGIQPGSLPPGRAGSPYAQTLQAAGGSPPYTFAVTAGALPPGLSLATGGVLSGTPTIPGSYNFTVTATDANGCTGIRAYALLIDPPACGTITVSPSTLANGTVGVAYGQTLTASGGTSPYTFAVTAGTLPRGLSLAAGGALSGMPTAVGNSNFTVTVTDTNGCTGSQAYTLAIDCPTITVSPSTLPNGTVGVAYGQTLTASGGTSPYTFAVTAGTLPRGLSLAAGGALSGMPTAAGSSNFTVTATDTNGCTGSQAYTLAIDCPTITVSPASLPPGRAGKPYAQTLQAAGGSPPYTFTIVSGVLPAGLSLDPDGSLSGTPMASGRFAFTAAATDASGCTGSRAYTLDVGILANFLVGEGLGPTNGNGVKVYSGGGTPAGVAFAAYGANRWGTNVASGIVDAAVLGRLLTGPGPGDVYGPHVRGFDRAGAAMGKINYYAYATLRYGANPAAADGDADDFAEILTGPGPGAVFGPHVRGWNFDGLAVAAISAVNYFAYGTLKYGVNPASGDVDGDAFTEILTGPGPGIMFGPQVRGFDWDGGPVTAIGKVSFFAYATPQYGVNLAGGDVEADGFSEILTAPGPGAGPAFTALFLGFDYDAATVSPVPGFSASPYPATSYGGRVGSGDVNDDGREDLLTGAGRDPAASSDTRSYAYDGTTLGLLARFTPFSGAYGVNVAGAAAGY